MDFGPLSPDERQILSFESQFSDSFPTPDSLLAIRELCFGDVRSEVRDLRCGFRDLRCRRFEIRVRRFEIWVLRFEFRDSRCRRLEIRDLRFEIWVQRFAMRRRNRSTFIARILAATLVMRGLAPKTGLLRPQKGPGATLASEWYIP